MPRYYDVDSRIFTGRVTKNGITRMIEEWQDTSTILASNQKEAKAIAGLAHKVEVLHDIRWDSDIEIVRKKATAVLRADLPGSKFLIEPAGGFPIFTAGDWDTNSIILVRKDLAIRLEEKLPDPKRAIAKSIEQAIEDMFNEKKKIAPVVPSCICTHLGQIGIRFDNGSIVNKRYYDRIKALGWVLWTTDDPEMFVITLGSQAEASEIGMLMGMDEEMRTQAEPYTEGQK